MNCTKVDRLIQRRVDKIEQEQPLLRKIVEDIEVRGGRAILVGGIVRDIFLDRSSKDIDVEVHGMSLKVLEALLSCYGRVNYIGKMFGVLKVDELAIDWSLPRTDAAGRKPWVTVNPKLSMQEAFRRRDLTINAMGIDLHTREFLDFYNGYTDLVQKKLRAPDITLFIQDPLRLFRVMQFIGRFQMTPDDALSSICATMDIQHVSRERIEMEFEKLLLQSVQPSRGLRWLQQIKRLKEVLPELAATVGVPQEKKWHPEGDVFEHTMQAVDAAAILDYGSVEEKLTNMYAVLCHDIGKVSTTKQVDGVWKSIGHAEAGETLCVKLLKRITTKKKIIKPIKKLVRYHMAPAQFVKQNASDAAYKRLAHKLAPDVTMSMLIKVAIADKRGRNSSEHTPLLTIDPDIQEFMNKAKKLGVFHHPEKPLLSGKDFLDVIAPGPLIGKLVKKAYQLQLSESITEKSVLKKRVGQEVEKVKKDNK